MSYAQTNEDVPTLMDRAMVAKYLNLTERQVIAKASEPDFPEHTATWRQWYFAGREIAEYRRQHTKERKKSGPERRNTDLDTLVKNVKVAVSALERELEATKKRRRVTRPTARQLTFASA